GARPGDRPADRCHHPAPQGRRLHDPAGRAEYQVRPDRGRPPLHRRARPRRRRDSGCTARVEHGQAARLSGSLTTAFEPNTGAAMSQQVRTLARTPARTLATTLATTGTRIADRSLVLLCAAVLCSAACKKEPAGDKPADKSGDKAA